MPVAFGAKHNIVNECMLNVQQLHNMLQCFLLHVTYSYTLALLVTSCTADGVL